MKTINLLYRNSNSDHDRGSSNKSDKKKESWLSFLSGFSQISRIILSKDNIAKNLKYCISNPLVIMLGIGDYDKNIMPSLIGVSQDYINCISTFSKLGYCLFYQTKDNKFQYIDKKTKCNLDLRKCKTNCKLHWNDEEVEEFFDKAKEHILKYKHDSCIWFISGHGESDGILFDSTGEELSLGYLFDDFNGLNCPYLVDKPKIIFVDTCRGQPRTKHVKTIENVDKNKQNEMKTNVKMVKYTNLTFPQKCEKKKHDVVNTEMKSESKCESQLESQSESKETNENVFEKEYHKGANFHFIYGNPNGLAVADGGSKGGYLIRGVKRVFSNTDISLSSTFDECVRQIRAVTKDMAGTGTAQCVENVSTMTYNVVFKKRCCNKKTF